MGTTERRERERRQRRADILTAARRLFFTKGFRDTTIDEIARVTELARGTVYLYFATKEEIYATVMEEGLDIVYGLITASYSREASPLDNLLATLDASLRFQKEYAEYSNVLMLHRLEIHDLLSPELQQRMMAKAERIQDWFCDLLRQGITRGDFRNMPVEENAYLLLALNRGFLLMQSGRHCMLDEEALRSALHQFVTASVLAPD